MQNLITHQDVYLGLESFPGHHHHDHIAVVIDASKTNTRKVGSQNFIADESPKLCVHRHIKPHDGRYELTSQNEKRLALQNTAAAETDDPFSQHHHNNWQISIFGV